MSYHAAIENEVETERSLSSFLVLGNESQVIEGYMLECKESSSRMGCSP